MHKGATLGRWWQSLTSLQKSMFNTIPMKREYETIRNMDYNRARKAFIAEVISYEEWEAFRYAWRNSTFRYSDLNVSHENAELRHYADTGQWKKFWDYIEKLVS